MVRGGGQGGVPGAGLHQGKAQVRRDDQCPFRSRRGDALPPGIAAPHLPAAEDRPARRPAPRGRLAGRLRRAGRRLAALGAHARRMLPLRLRVGRPHTAALPDGFHAQRLSLREVLPCRRAAIARRAALRRRAAGAGAAPRRGRAEAAPRDQGGRRARDERRPAHWRRRRRGGRPALSAQPLLGLPAGQAARHCLVHREPARAMRPRAEVRQPARLRLLVVLQQPVHH
mmetsp:Transcript_26876/g.66549  ORF Transcript_26876/g.66549 Transcript_26876/m.66549 type:complete len:228 (-) Transcript_26876:777-1460(-)